MAAYRIAVYPGDGIGIEVTAEAIKALRAAASRFSLSLAFTEFDWGSRHWRRTGKLVPDDFLDVLRPLDAIFLGAIGDPANLPDHVTLAPLIEMRQRFDQYACVRPAKLLPGVTSPLRDARCGQVDFVVVRENSEGEYVNVGGTFKPDQCDEVAIQTAVHTRKGVERIMRYAFELARGRRRKLTVVTKSNALRHGMVLWDRVLEQLAPQYADVQTDKVHVDALTMHLVRRPGDYDVIVASNLFGDILSDLAGAVVGSLGLAPSANINPQRTAPSLFEPVHGSAPDIAGRGIANPLAAIRSAAMMLDFLGETAAATAIENAVVENLAENSLRTPDLGGKATTSEVGDDVARRIAAK